MRHLYLSILLLFTMLGACISNHPPKQNPIGGTISKNCMKVSWQFEGDEILFELEAPSTGWLAIGFNETSALPETYLLMACIAKGKPKAREFKTISPGDYRPIVDLGGEASIKHVEGQESPQKTTIRVKIPQRVNDGFHKALTKGSKWSLLLAFSREDDFKHHSMMRTSISIVL